MKTPEEFQGDRELITETKAKITATLERLKEDGLDLYGCDYVDVKDLAYIYHAAHYLLRYVEGLRATIAGMDIAQMDFCGLIKQLEAEQAAAIEDLKNAYSCFACKKFRRNGGDCGGGSVCMRRDFEWRGLPVSVSDFWGKRDECPEKEPKMMELEVEDE